MTQVINLLLFIGFIMGSFAISDFIIEKQEKQEKEFKRWNKKRFNKNIIKNADWVDVVVKTNF